MDYHNYGQGGTQFQSSQRVSSTPQRKPHGYTVSTEPVLRNKGVIEAGSQGEDYHHHYTERSKWEDQDAIMELLTHVLIQQKSVRTMLATRTCCLNTQRMTRTFCQASQSSRETWGCKVRARSSRCTLCPVSSRATTNHRLPSRASFQRSKRESYFKDKKTPCLTKRQCHWLTCSPQCPRKQPSKAGKTQVAFACSLLKTHWAGSSNSSRRWAQPMRSTSPICLVHLSRLPRMSRAMSEKTSRPIIFLTIGQRAELAKTWTSSRGKKSTKRDLTSQVVSLITQTRTLQTSPVNLKRRAWTWRKQSSGWCRRKEIFPRHTDTTRTNFAKRTSTGSSNLSYFCRTKTID